MAERARLPVPRLNQTRNDHVRSETRMYICPLLSVSRFTELPSFTSVRPDVSSNYDPIQINHRITLIYRKHFAIAVDGEGHIQNARPTTALSHR